MGHKIFISYKYADTQVKTLEGQWNTSVRDYVDKLEDYIKDKSDHVYKAEQDGDDLSNLDEDTIWEKLKDRIFDSTLTIVMISKGMKDAYASDQDQWIPWEVKYSLQEETRRNSSGNPVRSSSNALLAIVLPDYNNDYSYYLQDKNCCASGCRLYKTDFLFNILKNNTFNIKSPDNYNCETGSTIYHGDCSYMSSVKWCNFIQNPEKYINKAYNIQSKINQYNICKEI